MNISKIVAPVVWVMVYTSDKGKHSGIFTYMPIGCWITTCLYHAHQWPLSGERHAEGDNIITIDMK